MRWTVEGADAATGRDRAVAVEAASPEQAEQVACGQGLLVARVSAATAAARTKPPALPPGGDVQPIVGAAVSPLQLPYRSPPPRHAPPEYRRIEIGAFVLDIFGALTVLGGVVICLAAVAGLLGLTAGSSPPPVGPSYARAAAPPTAAWAGSATLLVFGLVWIGWDC